MAQEATVDFFIRGMANIEIEAYINGEKAVVLTNNNHLHYKIAQTGKYTFNFTVDGKSIDEVIVYIEKPRKYFFIMKSMSYSFKESTQSDWNSIAGKINKVLEHDYVNQELGSSFDSKVLLDYSTINFYTDKITRENIIELFLGNQSVGNIQNAELLSCKLFSEGRIKISYLAGNIRKTRILDIENGNNYYLTLNKYTLEIEELLIVDWDKLFDNKVSDTIEFVEDKRNPIGELEVKKGASQGTGFLINNEGYVVTNFHVIEDAEEIKIKGIKNDYNTSFDASVIAVDAVNDLALLKINTKLISFDSPPFGYISSKEVKQAETVFALGYPIKQLMGTEMKITDGIINSKSGFKGGISEYQFSAVVQPGNSGGPLIDSKGNIVGVVTSKLRREIAESTNYAIKTDYLLFFLDQIEDFSFSPTEKSTTEMEASKMVDSYSKFIYIIETK